MQGERHQRSLAIRTEDTGHVSKLCVKTLFISENYHSKFRSFLCIVRNCNILHLQDVIRSHFDKTGVYASHCFIIHLPGGGQRPLVRDSEPIRLLKIPTSPSLYMLILYIQRTTASKTETNKTNKRRKDGKETKGNERKGQTLQIDALT